MLTDLWLLLHGDSKRGLAWWTVWTLIFSGLAVAYFVSGNYWVAFAWGSARSPDLLASGSAPLGGGFLRGEVLQSVL